MGTLRRLAAAVVLGLFVLRYALRPLGGTTALAELPRAWSDLLPFLPLVALSGLLLVLAGLAVVRGEGLPLGSESEPAQSSEPDEKSEFWAAERKKESVWETKADETDDETVMERYQNHPAVSPDLFGERESSGRIEADVPEAELRDHLAHLERELDDEAREELDALAAVAEETEAEPEIPTHCPAEGCDAVWSGRTVLGIRTDRYDELEDGRLICLDCEELYDPS
jgi:hypothetical protein